MKRALTIPRNCTELPAVKDTSITEVIAPYDDKLRSEWNDQAVFISREICETDPNYLQLIPYVVLIDFDGNFAPQVVSYRRPVKNTEQRLASLHSIGFGGHVEPDPNVVSSSITEPYLPASSFSEFDLEVELRNAASRELYEECGILVEHDRLIPHAMIYDHSNAVGQVHYGVLFTYAMRADDTIKPQNDEIEGMQVQLLDAVADDHVTTWEKWSLHAAKYLRSIPITNVLPTGMILELRQEAVERRDAFQQQQRLAQRWLRDLHEALTSRVTNNIIMWRGKVWQITPTELFPANIQEIK